MLGMENRPMLGKTLGMLLLETPNHLASVAEYSSTEVVGIQAPRLPVSSGPPDWRTGMEP